MKAQRQYRHLLLLFLSLIACLWAIVGLNNPSLMPSHVTVVNVVLIGAYLASVCPNTSPYVVARYSVLSICFGVGSLAFLLCYKSYFGFALGAVMCLYDLYMVHAQYGRQAKAAVTDLTNT